jgi:hypothetical protein
MVVRRALAATVDVPRRSPVSDARAGVHGQYGLGGRRWLLGHAMSGGHCGFPGDPLPTGHLGPAADLAFWAGVLEGDLDPEGTEDGDAGQDDERWEPASDAIDGECNEDW